MRLYHGTSLRKGKLILKEMKLRGSGVPKNYENIKPIKLNGKEVDSNTTDGYVYLGSFVWALDFGNLSACFEKDDEIIVFEMDIPDELLEADLDQIKSVRDFWQDEINVVDENNITAAESFEICQCVRVKGDIDLNETEIKYAIVKSTRHNEDQISNLLFIRDSNEQEDIKTINNFMKSLNWTSIKGTLI